MTKTSALKRIKNYDKLFENYERLVARKNSAVQESNGIITRYSYPIITADHIPVNWRYDLNLNTNPFGLERIGVNAAFNAGAIKWQGKYILAVRVEGSDRKSFFAFAESENGIDNFRFWDTPFVLPQNEQPDINAYDLRLVAHEDGYVYGIFCAERKDPSSSPYDTVSAIAKAGIIRSRDLQEWERLPDLICGSAQQRNVTLHPEFVNGKYALYTRPQDGFIETGSGGGIGLGYVNDMTYPVLENERIINPRKYHTVYEMKNGQGPSPLKTSEGWIHLAHGVRNTAAGLRYVLYAFMTDLEEIDKVIHQPGGYIMAPNTEEIVGDVGNVLFCNGWIADEDGKVYIYYASSDTRMHVATTSLEVLINYCKCSPEDGMNTSSSVEAIMTLIEKNKGLMTL